MWRDFFLKIKAVFWACKQAHGAPCSRRPYRLRSRTRLASMPWRCGTITVTDASPARRRGGTGSHRSPEGIPPTAGCRIGTATWWSANDKRCGRGLSSGERCIVSAHGKLAFPSTIRTFTLHPVTQNAAHVVHPRPAHGGVPAFPTY